MGRCLCSYLGAMGVERTRWGLVALAVSLAVHCCALAWLSGLPTITFSSSGLVGTSAAGLLWLEATQSPPITKPMVPPPQPFALPKPRQRTLPPVAPQQRQTRVEPDPRESDSPRVAALTPT